MVPWQICSVFGNIFEIWGTVKSGKIQLLRVKNNKLEAIFFVEKWTKVTQNVHKANTDKVYFLFNFSDLWSLHLDALHFTRFDSVMSYPQMIRACWFYNMLIVCIPLLVWTIKNNVIRSCFILRLSRRVWKLPKVGRSCRALDLEFSTLKTLLFQARSHTNHVLALNRNPRKKRKQRNGQIY